MPSIPEALSIAFHHHQAGRLAEAEAIYRQILAAEPRQADTLHLLGVLAHQTGRQQTAVELIGQAISLKPQSAVYHSDLSEILRVLGRTDEAIAAGGAAIKLAPGSAAAHFNLGNALKEKGRLEEAIAAYGAATQLQPDYAEAHHHLGLAFKEQGRPDKAIAAYSRAIRSKPDFAEAHNSLGAAYSDQGKLEEATACYRRALELKPDLAEAHHNLGNVFKHEGKLEEASASYRRALALQPDFAGALNNLGIVYQDQGELAQAMACHRRAAELEPDFTETHYNLGGVLSIQGKLEEAAACYRRALELKPDLAEAHNNLGNALKAQANLDGAMACYRRALEIDPGYAAAHSNLGNAHKDAGQLDEAIASYRRAIALEPNDDGVQSNLILTLHYHPAQDPDAVHEAHRQWNRQFADPLRNSIQPHANDRDPERQLRIGYVSPDFRDHVAGRYALPVLERHDHARFQVFCYASVAQPDVLTQRFQATADVWRDITTASHQAVADLIRADRIDLLVDLTMHMAGSRLPVFARKPAPVQACWLGYPGATGLSTIDYRLTDPYLDPPGESGEHSSEEPVRLPHSFWCYDPPADSPSVNPLPALSAGHITFGSLNNFCKVNDAVIALWSRVLSAVKDSRLLLLSKHGAHRERALQEFQRRGVEADRIEWSTPAPRPQYLAAYHRIDLGLDTFPYNGHTTSLDSVWMGVPVVTLLGNTIVGRGGLSQAMNLSLPELVAYSPDQYVTIAADLAQDLPRLSELRATLRDRMQASALMDALSFTRNIETAYRQMWRRWCDAEESRMTNDK